MAALNVGHKVFTESGAKSESRPSGVGGILSDVVEAAGAWNKDSAVVRSCSAGGTRNFRVVDA